MADRVCREGSAKSDQTAARNFWVALLARDRDRAAGSLWYNERVLALRRFYLVVHICIYIRKSHA